MILLLSLLPFGASQAALPQGEAACGALENSYGPYDYRTNKGPKLDIVEKFHFTPKIEALVGGETSPLPGDIGYTLRTFPNHHQALMALMRWEAKQKMLQETRKDLPLLQLHRDDDKTSNRKTLPLACYFDRAIRFRPDDSLVRMLFAQYLIGTEQVELAVQQLEQAIRFAGDNPLTHYNVGLLFLEAALPERALVQAHKAQELGIPYTELADKLKAMGKWREPSSGASSPSR